MDFQNPLWEAERNLMRLEALLAAHPGPALHWRTHAALIEATRSVEMNDETLDAGTLMLALMGQQTALFRSDTVALRQAKSIWRSICAPLSEDDLALAGAAGVSSGGLVTIIDDQVFTDRPDEPEDFQWAIEALKKLGTAKSLPLLGRLAIVPTVLRLAVGMPTPIAERLWMVLADHQWRRPAPIFDVASDEPRADDISARPMLQAPVDAKWLVMPASIMNATGFGIWSLNDPRFQTQFMERAAAWLARECDHLISLVRWSIGPLAEFSDKGRSTSKRGQLAALIERMPVLDARFVAAQIGVDERSARRILHDAEGAGVLEEVSGRHHYRYWMTPSMAVWVDQSRTARVTRRFHDPRDSDEAPAPPLPVAAEIRRHDRDDDLQALFDNLDALSRNVLEKSNQTAKRLGA